MTAVTTRTFTVLPVAADVVAQLRHRDDAGHEPEQIVDQAGGSPLRCCNRLSEPGERVLLASYAPVRRWAEEHSADPGPYDETGPIFIHAAPCAGPDDDGWPAQLRGAARVLRGYDANGRLRDGRFVPQGETDPERFIDELFADPQVAFIHARALLFGCFTFAVHRPR